MRKFKNEWYISEAPQVFIPASCFGFYHPAIDSETSLQQCWRKMLGERAFGYVWECGAVVLMQQVFDMEKEPPCTQHFLNVPWLLLTKPGFVERCVEGSRWQLASFCFNVSSKSSTYTWEFPALQLQIPQLLWRTHGTIFSPIFHTFGYSLRYFYPDGETRTQTHEERFTHFFSIGF